VDEMQSGAGVGTQSHDIAGIGGYLRAVENDVEHRLIVLRDRFSDLLYGERANTGWRT